jgi:hypothetical protein
MQPFLQIRIGCINDKRPCLDSEPGFPAEPMIKLNLADQAAQCPCEGLVLAALADVLRSSDLHKWNRRIDRPRLGRRKLSGD